jgi:uncharacterized integral membrane protein
VVIHDQQQEKVPTSGFGWFLILWHLGLGFLTIALAVDERFARGKVVFDHENWRIVLGVAGGFLAYRAARAVVRTVNRAPVELGAEQTRRARVWGVVSQLIGVAFLLAALNETVGEHSVDFVSWTKPVYVAGGILALVMGLVAMIDMAAFRQRQQEAARRIRAGQGRFDE